MTAQRIAAIFVVDGPHMQSQGLLLAASLRRYAHAHDLIAYVPASAPLPREVAAAFDALGVRCCALRPPAGIWAKPYPHGQKIRAAAAHRDVDATLFLDSDMFLARPLDLGALLGDAHVAAVPEGKPTWGKDEAAYRWERVYAHFGMSLPEERVRLTRGRRRMFLPYFNAGFVIWSESPLPDGGRFPELWLETARRIDREVHVAKKRPWLDQIALPVAAARAGVRIAVLDADLNFSLSNRARQPDDHPVVMHYHRIAYTAAWPEYGAACRDLAGMLGPRLMSALPADAMTAIAPGLAHAV